MSPVNRRSSALAAILAVGFALAAGAADREKVGLVIEGGHETDPRDRGRPVALVAGGLGVAPEVFREAFRGVRPARTGTGPSPEQARQNKAALLGVLGPHGVTNEELDRVSNRYRYVPGRGKLWPTRAAAGYAIVEGGALTSVVITDPGFGYNSTPTVSVAGHPDWTLRARVIFDRDLAKNGSIAVDRPRARGTADRP